MGRMREPKWHATFPYNALLVVYYMVHSTPMIGSPWSCPLPIPEPQRHTCLWKGLLKLWIFSHVHIGHAMSLRNLIFCVWEIH